MIDTILQYSPLLVVFILVIVIAFYDETNLVNIHVFPETLALLFFAAAILISRGGTLNTLLERGNLILVGTLVSFIAITYIFRMFKINLKRTAKLRDLYARAELTNAGDNVDIFNGFLIFIFIFIVIIPGVLQEGVAK